MKTKWLAITTIESPPQDVIKPVCIHFVILSNGLCITCRDRNAHKEFIAVGFCQVGSAQRARICFSVTPMLGCSKAFYTESAAPNTTLVLILYGRHDPCQTYRFLGPSPILFLASPAPALSELSLARLAFALPQAGTCPCYSVLYRSYTLDLLIC